MPNVVTHKDFDAVLRFPTLSHLNRDKILHGEEVLEVIKPIQPDVPYIITETLIDIQDKKKFIGIIEETTIVNK